MEQNHKIPLKVVIATGGTGGHIFPAQSLAEQLLKLGAQVEFIVDARFFPFYEKTKESFPRVAIHSIKAVPVSGNLMRKLWAALLNLFALIQAWLILRHIRPDVVVGFGGYPSLPTMLAAKNYVRIIHEQNAHLGLANRILARRVQHIITGFAKINGVIDECKNKVIHLGNPVRASILELQNHEYLAPYEGTINLLITGGSQAASIFADVVVQAIELLPQHLQKRLNVIQQAKLEQIENLREKYGALNVECEIAAFFADMPTRLTKAHLVIARAGASTIAELNCAGLPSILVPLPNSADNHQLFNARATSDAGGAVTLEQKDFSAQNLADILQELLNNPEKLAAIASVSRNLARPNAAHDLALQIYNSSAEK